MIDGSPSFPCSAIGRLGALARLRERKIGIAANQGETL
jgi:hypothetical protein